jgi:rod shape-determining protein MreC
MAELKQDLFTRRLVPVVVRSRIGISAIALAGLSLALLLLSRLDHSTVLDARWRMAELVAPVLSAAMVPLEPVRRLGRQIAAWPELAQENARLKAEIQQLRGWEWRARELERRVAALSALTRTVPQEPVGFATAQVIADSSGPFVRAVIVEAGREHSVIPGQPVINADGLVGRVVHAGHKAARALLLTDISSRIPVVIGEKQIRAIMIGDNGPKPKLTFLPPAAALSVGDNVSTSGVGGTLPRGLRIGRVDLDGDGLFIRLFANPDALDYVSILLFKPSEVEGAMVETTSHTGAIDPRQSDKMGRGR